MEGWRGGLQTLSAVWILNAAVKLAAPIASRETGLYVVGGGREALLERCSLKAQPTTLSASSAVITVS